MSPSPQKEQNPSQRLQGNLRPIISPVDKIKTAPAPEDSVLPLQPQISTTGENILHLDDHNAIYLEHIELNELEDALEESFQLYIQKIIRENL